MIFMSDILNNIQQEREVITFDTLLNAFCEGDELVDHLFQNLIPGTWPVDAMPFYQLNNLILDGMNEVKTAIKNILPEIEKLGITYIDEILFLNHHIIRRKREQAFLPQDHTLEDEVYSLFEGLREVNYEREVYEGEMGPVTNDEWNQMLLEKYKREDAEKERKEEIQLEADRALINIVLMQNPKRAVFITSEFKNSPKLSSLLGIPVISLELRKDKNDPKGETKFLPLIGNGSLPSEG